MDFLEAVKLAGGTDASYEVGIVTKDIPGVIGYEEDDIVIFQKENYGRNDTLTVATPDYTRIPRNSTSENAYALSHSAIFNVPSKYVKKVEDITSVLQLV